MTGEIVRPTTGTIALYVDLERDDAIRVAQTIAATIREAGFGVALCDDQERTLGLSSNGAHVEKAVLLVTVGGDGTLLRAAQIAAPNGIPLFGINTGRLGFLTEIDGRSGEIAKLPAILRDGFTIDERAALVARVHGHEHLALNDIVMRRTENAHVMRFGIYVNGREAAHVTADGVVVATATGSTAYFLSAGGPVISPDVSAFGIIALLPHTLFARPLIVPDSSTIALTCDAEIQGAALEADGRTVDRLQPGDRVEVRRYPLAVRFARRAPLDFFSVLEDKLRWNAPIKEREGR
ncbi:MAG: NAD(+)/NADH kinase [Candidatus Eremiobacteraeota bacterium]|nr:NAD(+)/NADH kinase [Candidatus Eremiobacteraeota bacterium]